MANTAPASLEAGWSWLGTQDELQVRCGAKGTASCEALLRTSGRAPNPARPRRPTLVPELRAMLLRGDITHETQVGCVHTGTSSAHGWLRAPPALWRALAMPRPTAP